MRLARKAAIWTNVVFDEVVFQGGLDWAPTTYGLELIHNQIFGLCCDFLIIVNMPEPGVRKVLTGCMTSSGRNQARNPRA